MRLKDLLLENFEDFWLDFELATEGQTVGGEQPYIEPQRNRDEDCQKGVQAPYLRSEEIGEDYGDD